jgi:thiamine biosynthesis lipoprotein
MSDSEPWMARAQLRLGTLVSVRVRGLPPERARRALETAFRAISEIHALMSFHDPASDISRLNGAAATRAVRVDARTLHVMHRAEDISRASHGAFDISIAPLLVERGYLPRHASHEPVDPAAFFEDIEFLSGRRVRFRRPLWIDLGGIAKGYAVDHALERMDLPAEVQVCINAGGDLRVAGPLCESVLLRVEEPPTALGPVVHLSEGSLATSTGRLGASRHDGGDGPHFHAARRTPVGRRAAASVIATDCMYADALTKVVLALGLNSDAILRNFQATAFMHDGKGRWHRLGFEQ